MTKYLLGIAYSFRAIILCLVGTVGVFARVLPCSLAIHVEASAEPWVLCNVAVNAVGEEGLPSGPALQNCVSAAVCKT